MTQSSSRFCPQCGSPLEAGHRFCTNCGATTSIESNALTALSTKDQTALAGGLAQNAPAPVPTKSVTDSDVTASTIITPQSDTPGAAVSAPGFAPITPNTPVSGAMTATPPAAIPNVSGAIYSTVPVSGDQFYTQATDEDAVPPPPPPESFISTPQEAPASPYYTPPAPGFATVPAYAQAPKRSRGCLIASIVLLLVLVLGGVGVVFAVRSRNTNNNNQGNSGSNSQQSTPGSVGNTSVSGNTPSTGTTPGSGNTPGSGGPVTTTLNLKFAYSSVDITLVSVQLANSFPDDSSTPQGGVRVSMKESNTTTKSGNYVYGDVVRLIFPDGTTTPPSGEQNDFGPDSGVSRDNWLDFAVTNQSIDVSKLILRFGSANQYQMDIPLTPNADLSKYQPKTITPNTALQYAGLKWTVTSVTESLSANGQQAATGQVFITVILKVDNPTSSDFNAYWGDYIRLKSGNTTNVPTTDTTLPLNFAAGSKGSTGDVFFIMPSGGTSYTLILLNAPSTPYNQATATFQIQ